MKTAFLASAYLLLILVILALLGPRLWRKKLPDTSTRNRINALVYRDQLDELTHDRSTGALTEEDFQRAKTEMDRRVLEDMGHTSANTSAMPGQDPAMANRIAFLIVLFVPLLAMPLYFKLGNPAALEPRASTSNDQAAAITAEKIEAVLADQAKQAAQNPGQPDDWVVLIRSYRTLGHLADAEAALAKAGHMADTAPALMLEQIALAKQKTGEEQPLTGKPQRLLQDLLRQEPDNPMGLFYAGNDAYSRQQYTQAADYWSRVLQQVDAGSNDEKNLKTSIARAKEKAKAR